jgi:uncharacterized linocin/CFP29 family protein
MYVNRPVIKNGCHVINKETGQLEYKAVSIGNAGPFSALRRDDWLEIDKTVVEVGRQRLNFVADLRARGLQYVIPNGFGKTSIYSENESDTSDASVAMDPMTEGTADQPGYGGTHLPLPVIFKDFWLGTRQLAASRNGSSPLDLRSAEQASRKVSELAEKMALGVAGTSFIGGTIYGITNFPSRQTKAMTLPTDVGWTGKTFLDEVLAMRELSQLAYQYGPWVLYTSTKWDKYLDADYSEAKGDVTLRDRVKMISGIQDVVTLDYLGSNYTAVLVQMSNVTIQEVVGMEIMTVQWMPTPFRINFKVIGIMVPRMRTDANGNCGIIHGTAS